MKALYLENGHIEIREVEKPNPGPQEALIKILKAGICNTDIELIKGYMNFSGILGHEFVGCVTESAEPNWIGQRVVGDINLSCGVCDVCKRGESKHCPFREILGIKNKDGVFAEYITLPLKNLYPIPDSVSDNEAVFVEPLAAACEISEQIDMDEGKSVAVLGDGKLGQMIAQVMKLATPHVSSFGRKNKKLKRLQDKGIRTYKSLDAKREPFDMVIEATGSSTGIKSALKMVRPKGTIVLKSTVHGESNVDLSKIVVDELFLVGSRCGPFDRALELLKNKSVDVEDMVDREFGLEHGLEALSFAQNPDVLKVLLVP